MPPKTLLADLNEELQQEFGDSEVCNLKLTEMPDSESLRQCSATLFALAATLDRYAHAWEMGQYSA